MISIYIFAGCMFLLLYTYILYPAFAAIIGKLPTNHRFDRTKTISVLVPAFNESEVIESKIHNFQKLDYPPDLIEMIIVDDGSSDDTRNIILRNLAPNIKLLDPAPRSGKAAGINRMVKEAKHDMLLLCDANVMFHPEAASRLAEHMNDPQVGAVTGQVKLVGSNEEFESGESLYYRIEKRIQCAESLLGSVMGVDGGMYLLRKNLFTPLEHDTILDDFTISVQVMRSSHRIIYDPLIQATESGTATSSQEYKRRVRMMAGVVQLFRRGIYPRWYQLRLWFQFISHKVLRWITPFLLTTIFLTSILLMRDNEIFLWIVTAQLAFYGFFAASYFIPQLRTFRITSIAFYFLMSQVAMIEGLVRGCFNRQGVLWEKGRRAKLDQITEAK